MVAKWPGARAAALRATWRAVCSRRSVRRRFHRIRREVKNHRSKDLAPLDALVARLRGPGGCPWDREQGFDEIRAYLLEEAHEVAAAIDARDWPELTGELGDLLFQLAFLGRLNEERGRPGLERSIARVEAKMIERHPHVFGDAGGGGAAGSAVGGTTGGPTTAAPAPIDGAQRDPAPELDADAVAAAWERR